MTPAGGRGVVAALMLAASAFSVAQSAVVPALTTIQRELAVSATDAAWIVTSTLIGGAVVTPLAARAGDVLGKRRVMLAVLAVTAAGLLLAIVASSFATLLGARVIQGAGGGIYPLAFAIVRDRLPPGQVAGAIGLIGSVLSIGAGAGALGAGFVADRLDFRWLFAIPLALVLAAAACVVRWVPESPLRSPGPIGFGPALPLGLALAALLLGITQSATAGWLAASTLAYLAAGAALAIAWAAYEARTPAPLVDLATMRLRGVWTANAVTLLFGIGMFCAFTVIPQLAQQTGPTGLGLRPGTAGLLLGPLVAAQIVMAALAGRLDRRLGPKRPVLAGCALLAAGYVQLAFAHDGAWQLVTGSILVGVGVGMSFTALPSIVVHAVPQSRSGIASGVNNVLRIVGGAFGTQVAATCLATHLDARGLPTSLGYGLAFATGAVAAVAALALAALIPERR